MTTPPPGSIVAAPLTDTGADWAHATVIAVPDHGRLCNALARADYQHTTRHARHRLPDWDTADEHTRDYHRARVEHLVQAVDSLLTEAGAR